MKKEAILVGIIGLLAGALIAGGVAVFAVNSDNRGVMQAMGMNASRMQDSGAGHMGMSMTDMTNDLRNRTGDDFDQAFIAMMIAHHQGAIAMAELAEEKAKHEEIRDMANDIITTQSTEINTLKMWQVEWGYTESMQGMRH